MTRWTAGRSRIGRAVLGLALVSLALAGCAGGGEGAPATPAPETSAAPVPSAAAQVGFLSFVTAGPAEAPQACEELFGSAEALSQVLLVDVALDGGADGVCHYRTATGSQLELLVSQGPEQRVIAQSTKGEYVVSLRSQAAHLSPTPALDGENRASFQQWLDSRALALVEDYESWRASLPSVQVPFALAGTAELDSLGPAPVSVGSTGILETPAGRFELRGASRVGHLVMQPRGERTSAGQGREFLLVDLDSRSGDLELRDAQLLVRTALGESVVPSAASPLVVVVDESNPEASLVVRTDGIEQAIDLISGEVDDEGRSLRLAARGSGMLHCSRSGPLVRFASGSEKEAHLGAFDGYVRWSRGPWVEGVGWAGPDEELLTVTLDPSSPEHAKALSEKSASARLDGEKVAAESFDLATHTFVLRIPATPDHVEVEVTLEPDLRASYLKDWKKVLEPQVMECLLPLS